MKNFTRKLIIVTSVVSVSVIAFTLSMDSEYPSLEQRSEMQSAAEQRVDLAPPNDSGVAQVDVNARPQESLIAELMGGDVLSLNALQKAFSSDDPAFAWAQVDLEELQNEMPDNLYWALAAPTDDPVVQEQRKEIKEFWEQQYGEILSNRATEVEIRAYYEHRNQVSTDYIVFATALLNRHSTDLPERDYHFQILARNVHLAQLEELPQKLQQALENRERFEQRRSEWLANKSAFESQLHAEREAALRDLGKI